MRRITLLIGFGGAVSGIPHRAVLEWCETQKPFPKREGTPDPVLPARQKIDTCTEQVVNLVFCNCF